MCAELERAGTAAEALELEGAGSDQQNALRDLLSETWMEGRYGPKLRLNPFRLTDVRLQELLAEGSELGRVVRDYMENWHARTPPTVVVMEDSG